jgi:hypothetical protein
MLNRAIRRNKRFENRRANMVMKRRMMHEREWEMMYPSRLFRVDHLPVNDVIKSGFTLQRDGRWYVDPERSATLNEFMQFLQIKDADNQPVQIRSDNKRVRQDPQDTATSPSKEVPK